MRQGENAIIEVLSFQSYLINTSGLAVNKTVLSTLTQLKNVQNACFWFTLYSEWNFIEPAATGNTHQCTKNAQSTFNSKHDDVQETHRLTCNLSFKHNCSSHQTLLSISLIVCVQLVLWEPLKDSHMNRGQ